MKKIVSFTSLAFLSSSLYANVDIKSLDIYKNRTFVNQMINIEKQSVNLINNVRFEDIRFIVNGECRIDNVSSKLQNHKNDELTKKIEKLRRNIAYKNSELKSIKSSIAYYEGIKFEEEAVNLQNIKNVTKFAKEEISKAYNTIYDLDLEIIKLNEKLVETQRSRDSNKYTTLNYNASCLNGSSIYVSYPVYNVQKNNFFEVNANSKSNKVEIKNKAYLTQNSGYDFDNIDLNFYTFNYNNQIVPRKFYPKYLDLFEEAPVHMMMEADAVMEKKVMMSQARAVKAKAPVSSYHETSTKSFFKVSGVSLKNAIKTPLELTKKVYDSKNSIEIDGYSSSKTFYKVEFKSDTLFNSSTSKLYLDSIFIGNAFIKEIKKNKETSVYFGEDRFIDVKKDLIKDMKEKPFFSVNKLKTQKLWKYEITNNNKVSKKITLVERLPISKHEDIKVKLISKTKYSSKDDKGKISYDFVIKPNEKKIIEFGYEIEKPYKK